MVIRAAAPEVQVETTVALASRAVDTLATTPGCNPDFHTFCWSHYCRDTAGGYIFQISESTV